MATAQLEVAIGKRYVVDGLEYIALYLPNNKLVSIVRTNNNKYVDPSKLESLVQTYQEKKSIREGIKSINEFNDLIRHYINSGEKNILDRFLIQNGYSPSKILEGREASNIIEEAVAYTDTKNMFGVYLNFKKAIEKMIQRGKISEKIAKYIIPTHELLHTAQAQTQDLESIVGKTPVEERRFRLNIEYEAEMLMTALLYHKAAIAKSPKESREWYSAARYTLHRAQVIEEWARRKDILLDKKEKLTNIVENYFNQYSDYLNKGYKSKNIFLPKPIYNPI